MAYFTKGSLIFILLTTLILQCKDETASKDGGNMTEDDLWFSKLPDLTSEEREVFQGVYEVEVGRAFAEEYAPDAKIQYSYINQCAYFEPNGKIFRIWYTNNDQEIFFNVKRESDTRFVFKRGNKHFSALYSNKGWLTFILFKDPKSETDLAKTNQSYEDCHEQQLNIFKSGG
ncbi:hypothetical protein [Leptospira koniambonensis]|uniref:hypothetical protein n=1 Tax=Leptospira koniambonensis TaxID=2484950 RepID=UPI003EC11659